MTTNKFDYNEPLPDLHIQQQRSWEPDPTHPDNVTIGLTSQGRSRVQENEDA